MISLSPSTLTHSYSTEVPGSILLLHSNFYDNPDEPDDTSNRKNSFINTVGIPNANNRTFSVTRLRCIDGNQFHSVINDERHHIIAHDPYTIVLHGFKKKELSDDNQFVLTENSTQEKSDYTAVPLVEVTLERAIAKVQSMFDQAYVDRDYDIPEGLTGMNMLLHIYFKACTYAIPSSNSEEQLRHFVLERMLPQIRADASLNSWKKYWGPSNLFSEGGEGVLSNLINGFETVNRIGFYRRFICENWAKFTGVAATFTDGQHRQSCFEHGICHVDPESFDPTSNNCRAPEFLEKMQSYALEYRYLTFSFQTRIPTVLNKTIINELCAESRDIQEKNERAKGAGLLPHLNQVATGIRDSFGDQKICYFHNSTSITYLKGEATAADRETLNTYIDNGNNDVYLDLRERCNRYCNLWARKTILVIVSQMKKHNIHNQTLTRRDRARHEHHTKRTHMFGSEDEKLANDMIEALQSINNQQRKKKTNQIFPTVLGTNRPTTIVDYYYQLLDPATIEGRYGPMKGFLAVDIDCVQILLWACHTRESLDSLIAYLQKPSYTEKIQYEGKHVTDLELHTNALASLCVFVSTCVLRYNKNMDGKDEVSKCMHAHLIASSAFRDGLAFISEAGLNPKTHLIDVLRRELEICSVDKEICAQFLRNVEGYDIEEVMKSAHG